MPRYHGSKRVDEGSAERMDAVPEAVQLSRRHVLGAAKEGLLALSVAAGLQVLSALMEAEVTRIVGPKGKHNPARKAGRHGRERGRVVLGGRTVAIERPRVRTVDGHEVQLRKYAEFQRRDPLNEIALERMLHGLAARRYEHGLEPVGDDLSARGTSKSAVSRRFIAQTRTALAELLSRPLRELGLVALLIDGVVLAEHTCVVALGIDGKGDKHIVGLREGATENATVCRALLSDLVGRGLRYEDGLLVVIDGSKALRAAVRDVFGEHALVQRCQVHKERNVLEHLPERERG